MTSAALLLEPEGSADDERRCFSNSGRLAKSSSPERLILESSAKKLYKHEHGKRFLTDVPRGLLVFLKKPEALQALRLIAKPRRRELAERGVKKRLILRVSATSN